MKHTMITVLALLFALNVSFSQGASDYFKAIENNDLSLFQQNLSDDIELCIKDSPDFFTKSVAITKIKEFLDSVGVESCEEVHSGTSSNQSRYWVGKLKGKVGTYRVFIYKEGNEIVEVRFDDFN